MALIKLNEGEGIYVSKNHDKSEKPFGYLLMVREGRLMIREFGERQEDEYQFLKDTHNIEEVSHE